MIFSGVTRAFPGERLAHPEGQNEEENEKSLKSKNKLSKFGAKKLGKWNSCQPGTVRLATALMILWSYIITIVLEYIKAINLYQIINNCFWSDIVSQICFRGPG